MEVRRENRFDQWQPPYRELCSTAAFAPFLSAHRTQLRQERCWMKRNRPRYSEAEPKVPSRSHRTGPDHPPALMTDWKGTLGRLN